MPNLNDAAGAMIQGLMGIGLGAANNQQQYGQQVRLNNLATQNQMAMTNFNQDKAYEMWKKTNYKAQVEEMKKAGLNPALMYGMGGGGGTTAQVTPGTGGQGQAAANASTMGIQTAMELRLLEAQKNNIEADTENKKMDTILKDQTQYGKGLENAMTEYLQSTDMKGNETGAPKGSIKEEEHKTQIEQTKANTKFKLDENERQALLNSKVMQEIGQRISLMKSQGLKEDEIYKNLQKEGKLLDAEIEWNKLDIEGGNVGKFITNIIKMAFKPK